jgi:hypothetical protein
VRAPICSCGGAREMVMVARHEARYTLTILCYLCATTKSTTRTSATTTLFHCFHTRKRHPYDWMIGLSRAGLWFALDIQFVTWPTDTDYAGTLQGTHYRLDVARSSCKELLQDASGQRLSRAIVRPVPLTCSSWKLIVSPAAAFPLPG